MNDGSPSVVGYGSARGVMRYGIIYGLADGLDPVALDARTGADASDQPGIAPVLVDKPRRHPRHRHLRRCQWIRSGQIAAPCCCRSRVVKVASSLDPWPRRAASLVLLSDPMQCGVLLMTAARSPP